MILVTSKIAMATSEEFDVDAYALSLAEDDEPEEKEQENYFCVWLGSLWISEFNEKLPLHGREIIERISRKKGDGTGFKLSINYQENSAVMNFMGPLSDIIIQGPVTFKNDKIINMTFDWVASEGGGYDGESFSKISNLTFLRNSDEFYQSMITTSVDGESKTAYLNAGRCNKV